MFILKYWRLGVKLAAWLFTLLILTLVIVRGYDTQWTGFGEYKPQDGDPERAKTLWDWLKLLVVPIVLAVGGYFLEGSRKRFERTIENDRHNQQILDDYFEYISKLLLEKHLGNGTDQDVARDLARTRTLSALRLLDGKRKAHLLQFIYETGLIERNPIIDLNGADLKGALLDEAVLSGAEIRGAYFNGATIRRAHLIGTDLRGCDFARVCFADTDFTDALLRQAMFNEADLRKADIATADMRDVDCSNTYMRHAQRKALNERNSTG
ncbi:MAG: pentapeptide repeat-containing protein [Gammaproteobacteria bacterium]|nr:pentapeptide repeat-containing protein [Gammaproteobacteria bacterium]MCB1926323.1 pentapeptide repeat-containing protein [Gammaproteobacteria bacterium]